VLQQLPLIMGKRRAKQKNLTVQKVRAAAKPKALQPAFNLSFY
jgi:hypothetical protein